MVFLLLGSCLAFFGLGDAFRLPLTSLWLELSLSSIDCLRVKPLRKGESFMFFSDRGNALLPTFLTPFFLPLIASDSFYSLISSSCFDWSACSWCCPSGSESGMSSSSSPHGNPDSRSPLNRLDLSDRGYFFLVFCLSISSAASMTDLLALTSFRFL